MPSKSLAQHNLMSAVAHNPAFAKKAGISQAVGRDFVAADKKVHKAFAKGGRVSALVKKGFPVNQARCMDVCGKKG